MVWGKKESKLISAVNYRPTSYDYDLYVRRNFDVTTNACGYPVKITYDQYEGYDFQTGHYELEIFY